jgi:TetR/AcrR family transcriptional regulator
MNDVAERVGMRKASLFYHFATKDALYEAVLDRLVVTIGSALAAIYSADGSFAERLETSAETATTVLATHPFAARLLLREAMDWGPVIRGKLGEHILAVLEASTGFLRAGQEAGAFVDGDPRHMVLTALGVHFLPFALGHLVQRYAGTDPFDPGFVAARCVAVRKQVRDMIVR